MWSGTNCPLSLVVSSSRLNVLDSPIALICKEQKEGS